MRNFKFFRASSPVARPLISAATVLFNLIHWVFLIQLACNGLFVFCPLLFGGEAGGDVLHGSVVVATVNGKPITFRDVWKRVGRRLEYLRTVLPDSQFRKEARKALLLVLQDLIDRELLLAKAKEAGIKVTDRQIDSFAEQEMAYFNEQGENLTSLEDYFRAIQEETGLSEKEYREELRARVAISQYLRKYVWKPEYFSPELVRRYWKEHREEFRVGGYVEIRHIYIQRENPNYEKIVQYIQKAIKEGRFDEAAKEAVEKGWSHRFGRDGAGLYRYSVEESADLTERENVDGSLKSLWEPLAKAILQMKVGQAVGPIRSSLGAHFVKLVRRGGGRVRSFSEVQREIQQKLLRELEEKVKRAFLRELLKSANIKRFPFPEETPVGPLDWGSGKEGLSLSPESKPLERQR